MATENTQIYHERQKLQFCLLHSLNNLFQVTFHKPISLSFWQSFVWLVRKVFSKKRNKLKLNLKFPLIWNPIEHETPVCTQFCKRVLYKGLKFCIFIFVSSVFSATKFNFTICHLFSFVLLNLNTNALYVSLI